MKKHSVSGTAALLLFAGVLLAGCASGGRPPSGAQYRCEHDLAFQVKFVDDTAVLDSTKGSDLLFRDAGGQGAQQTVYSNPRLRAEFGLGASGREAVLRYALLPLVVRCVRD
ncbi:MAG: hypothetical protein ABIP46_02945 [Polaromonas sp.]